MNLTHAQLEEIAEAAILDFRKFMNFNKPQDTLRFPMPTPIDQFARDYLGLRITFAPLSSGGSVCGLTAYSDTEYKYRKNGVDYLIPLTRNDVLLDARFIEPENIRKLCGRRRFTLAHECAHQLLYQMDSDSRKLSCRRQYAPRTAYSFYDLKSREDWNEWQANALGAAILMPQSEMDLAMRYCTKNRPLRRTNGRFSNHDETVVTTLCSLFGVSRTALLIRLDQLEYIDERSCAVIGAPKEVFA